MGPPMKRGEGRISLSAGSRGTCRLRLRCNLYNGRAVGLFGRASAPRTCERPEGDGAILVGRIRPQREAHALPEGDAAGLIARHDRSIKQYDIGRGCVRTTRARGHEPGSDIARRSPPSEERAITERIRRPCTDVVPDARRGKDACQVAARRRIGLREGGTKMLVLRRKAGEAIVLNGVITIHVLAVEGERVKLGISAPPEVVIVRSELLENQSSVSPGPSQSGPYWTNREPQRPSHERGVGGVGGEGRPHPQGERSETDPRDAAAPHGDWRSEDLERTTPASIYTIPQRES
jgi:carbon storage regulator